MVLNNETKCLGKVLSFTFFSLLSTVDIKKSDAKFSNGKYKKLIRNSDVETLCKIKNFRIKAKLTFLIKTYEANTEERPKITTNAQFHHKKTIKGLLKSLNYSKN